MSSALPKPAFICPTNCCLCCLTYAEFSGHIKVVVNHTIRRKNNRRTFDFAVYEKSDGPQHPKEITAAMSHLATNFLYSSYDKMPIDWVSKKFGTSHDSGRPFVVRWTRCDSKTFILEMNTLMADEDPQPVEYEELN